jgi:hypothetical protein
LVLSFSLAETAAQSNFIEVGPSYGASSERSVRDRADMTGGGPARGGAGVLNPATKLRCPSSDDPVDRSDPPSTSALTGSKDFVASKHFWENISPASEVKISWLGANFTRRFIVKIERNPAVAALRVYALTRSSRSIGIVEELRAPFETRLADVWCLLRLQPNGERGALLTNAMPNLFFVRDAAAGLGVVDVLWSGAGWEIGASSLTSNRPWPAGLRVIAR